MGIFARYQSETDFYYAALRGDGKLHARKRVGDSNSSIGTSHVVDGGWLLDTWYRVGFAVQGSTLTMYVDGVEVRTESDSDISAGGWIGIGTFEDATAIFEDVQVTAL